MLLHESGPWGLRRKLQVFFKTHSKVRISNTRPRIPMHHTAFSLICSTEKLCIELTNVTCIACGFLIKVCYGSCWVYNESESQLICA